MKKSLLFTLFLVSGFRVFAQETFPVNGVQDQRPDLYAFTHATIFVNAETVLQNATLVIRGKKIESVGTAVQIPQGAVVTDLKGKFIYPAFIDAFTSYGLPEIKAGARSFRATPQFLSSKKGAYNWNEAIVPEYDAKSYFQVDEKKAADLRKLGFGAVNVVNRDGIARGTSAFVTLANGKENEVIANDRTSSNYSFSKGTSTQDYPSALMGCIALLRQTYYDVRWYKASANKTDFNISLDELNKQQTIPQIFEVDNVLDILRADKIGDEFGVQYIFKSGGDEYKRLDKVKATNGALIVPLNFPKPYEVEDPYEAMQINLSQLKNWELAPSNPGQLEKAGIKFSITSGDGQDFWENLRKAIDNGLSEKQALKALTETPAELLNVTDKVGSLKTGMYANFIITSANLFKKDNLILENWVQGQRLIVNNASQVDLRGLYNLKIESLPTVKLTFSGKSAFVNETSIQLDTVKAKPVVSRLNEMLNFNFSLKNLTKGNIALSGYISNNEPLQLKGTAVLADGKSVSWVADWTEAAKENQKSEDPKPEQALGTITYPFIAFGFKELPKAEKLLIKNVTVWTNEKEGKLENTDVLLDGGKIVQLGKNLSVSGAKEIDGTGKHLTAGIIDEHSHIAISRGINEGTQSVTSEVRIGDIINSEDINIYRQLAGGVTSSHILHGSANVIGGQTQLIKLRWGKSPEELKFENSDGFIKFALGENVKQANWGENQRYRFPQTRMGVEQVLVDAFQRAKEYQKQWDGYNKSKSGVAPRKDLELDALVEILNKKRFITCHSYVQSEINMLMHVADSMGFKVNTFTHILEGYKVADKIKAHGAAGSTFSDWWAYKMEVKDAIPYNGAIMHSTGLLVAFNSDDAEMARRLNQEAAKAVKYGDVSEEEAWKFVTLNPAKMLHVDNKVGSIKVGKDADVVLWSASPLSVYAKAEKTIVDGIVYFDIDRDKQLQADVKAERARIIQKMIDAKTKGEKTQKPMRELAFDYHCDSEYHFGGTESDADYNYRYGLEHKENQH
ncbi:amidohydrolase family protein [Solitalea sp. MAHUQ-68]|uniref:Amidohydrolase family protein n=1 Tax=Solitalea agri TaxID=2953739 RepID=A0A9X2JDN5_9SPHI|nr:amidohydrolase family protein [Solitalea agri]MCO4294338.1 amidohydrolase family protein [Solitalea agri]